MCGWRASPGLDEQVRARARGLCEYCHADERWQYVRFTVDHVQARAVGGDDTLENLALACFHCNRWKSDRAASEDPVTKESAPLFDPRRDDWSQHFRWSADLRRIEGVTPSGRATVDALRMNRDRAIQIREADTAAGRHPPAGDPVAPA